ncbi:MAG: PQQ-dependent sugar dehydrogenase [Candidatus Promineifilaceae bacterium]|nr:PQQ-dependent sugar dehydrogenase [Candidatus Promineifilaceae bacterium]
MLNKRLAVIAVAVLALSGCQQGETEEAPSPAATSTGAASTAMVEGPSPTSGATTVSETPATATPAPTSTASPAPPTATTAPTVTPTATPQAVSAVSLAQVAGGFERPTYLTHAGDERLFVLEQVGRISILSQGQRLGEPFLDIRDRVGSANLEQGLLSVAFHPQHASNGRFFVYYTDRGGTVIVAEYRVHADDTNRADAESERVLLSVPQPYPNHNGGQLQFGPDGFLYIGLGDGGSAGDPQGHGQNRQTLLGSLLRIDVDAGEPYDIPGDNPFVEQSEVPDEIYAYGLRNPWRFSFDRATSDLFLADVGQQQWEEVNFVPRGEGAGANFGWNILEGTHCYQASDCDANGTILPVAEYNHQPGHCSVTGGYVYRGEAHEALTGNYFFADYCSGTIWAMVPGPEGRWTWQVVQQSGLRIASFGQDLAGELYVLDHEGGQVLRLQP